MLQSMKDMGFPASLSPGPNDFTRVLVGPYTDNADHGKGQDATGKCGTSPR